MATLGDVKAALQSRGYGTDTTDAQTEFVRSALRRVYGMRRWRFLLDFQAWPSTVVGDATFDLSLQAVDGTIGAIDSVRLVVPETDTLVDLSYVDLQELTSLEAQDDSLAEPQVWTQQTNSLLRFWPTPDAEYLVHVIFMLIPTLPTVDTDVLLFPEQHLEVLVEYAAMLIAKRQRDWQAYNAAKQDFTEAITDMIRAEGLAQRQTSASVARWSGWDDVER